MPQSGSTEQQSVGGWNDALGEHASNPSNPRTTGFVVNSLGADWRFSSCENRIKGQFEEELCRRALAHLRQDRRELSEEESDKQLSIFMADRAAGHYSWDGKYGRGARNDWPGIFLKAYLLLRRCHPDMTLEQAEAIVRDNLKETGEAFRWAEGNSKGSSRNGSSEPAMPPAGSTVTSKKPISMES